MTRFYGAATVRERPPEMAAAKAARSLETAGTAPAARRNARGVVALEAGSEASDLWGDETGFAVVHGAPHVTGDAAFAAAVAQHGIARACALRYAESGPRFLAALQGPFALAVQRADDGRTLLAVDKLGIYSLYYADGAELEFSNKLAALRRVVAARIDPQAVYDYLYFHHVPSPATIYEEIKRLPPAAYLERRGSELRLERYWTLHFEREAESIDFAREKHEFVELLRGAVRRELESHRVVGCFLSGGTDSSTLAGMVTRVGGQPARTYSIGFEQQGFDEMEYARIAVRHFGTKQKEYYLQPADIVSFTPRIAEIYGQPFGNSSAVPTYYCGMMARADGVDTMIAGDGGDELFGGNQRYATQQLFGYYEQVPAALRRYVLEPLAFRTPGAKAIFPLRKLGRYIEQAREPMPGRLQTYNYLDMLGHEAIFEPEFLRRVDTANPKRAFAHAYDRADAHDMLNKIMALDLKFTLTDNDLPKVVESCGAANVGVAFPFLAQEIVDFAARLPAAEKVKRLKLRHFFKEALGDFLPQEIIKKKKHGFGMPFGDWLANYGPLRALALDSMAALKSRGVVRASFIDDLCSTRLRSHPNYYGGFLWILMIFELWAQWDERQTRGQAAPGPAAQGV